MQPSWNFSAILDFLKISIYQPIYVQFAWNFKSWLSEYFWSFRIWVWQPSFISVGHLEFSLNGYISVNLSQSELIFCMQYHFKYFLTIIVLKRLWQPSWILVAVFDFLQMAISLGSIRHNTIWNKCSILKIQFAISSQP